MEATVPWEAFLALIEPVYHKPSSKRGRPPIPLKVMLRIHLLQQWFTLSDPLMEEMLIDRPCFRRFAGIETMGGRIPDETTTATAGRSPRSSARTVPTPASHWPNKGMPSLTAST
ncbi:MAG: transposase [Aphanothece saxicola GSE-SYN-MK-01-06B]|jgi:IS5 family transposase|nr:transposase [Aphanothece saxicola GSE-SYN-MK-01-06B]